MRKRRRTVKSVGSPRKGVRLRKMAYQVLWAVERGADADTVLENFRSQLWDPRDRDLLTEIVQGVLRKQAYLDHVLHALTGGSYYDLDPAARILLRIGLYQLLEMDRIPPYAAVHATVEVSRHISGVSTKLVNAVLRKAVGLNGRSLLPDRAQDPIRYLAVRYSFPQWMVRRWVEWWGEAKAEAVLQALQARPVLYIRRHLPVPDERFIELLRQERLIVEPVPGIPDCFRVVEGRPQRTPSFRKGYFAIQDATSQIVSLLVRVRPGETLLDACAAPGNKTTRFLQQMDYRGTVVVADVSPARLRETLENLRRWLQRERLSDANLRVLPIVGDMRTPPLRPDVLFDWVVVDAPCSNLGVAHRHPELKWRLRPEDIQALGRLQGALLAGVAPHVRPGGFLLYAVCTLEREETYDVVEAFLKTHPDFSPVPLRSLGGPACIEAFIEDRHFFVAWPDRFPADGFFGVVFRRRAS
ncbi:Ribosomal RNA small subunit methyltransferase B [bacterium HR11]|nr:Ribosomal RNA small subunit methyltransferase B [bacterium HR11]